jgi:D-sedoheptulose 7-phosphate isomerase
MSDQLEARFRRQVEASIQAKQALLSELEASLSVARALLHAYGAGGVLYTFGNGGSAADAQHIAAEFAGRMYADRRALPAHALTVNTSTLTAIGNDLGFEQVFARQIEALGRPGDVALGITTSGNSANVVAGLRAARRLGMLSVALTGADGGAAREAAELWVGVPSRDVARVQECHILLGHIWSELVEAQVAASD